jgi:antitoxin component HigA of HigAB toxin-antitoxin module
MDRILTDVTRITTRVEFDLLKSHVNNLINEATRLGYLAEQCADNEYTREIARLGKIGAQYESEFLNLPIRSDNPLIAEIDKEIRKRGLSQCKAAALIGINEPTFSAIMRGKRRVSMKMAKRLFHEFEIDPKMIIEYS